MASTMYNRAEHDPFRHQAPPSVIARNRQMSSPQSSRGYQHPPTMVTPRHGADVITETRTTADGAEILPARRPSGAPEQPFQFRGRNPNREAYVMNRSLSTQSQEEMANWSVHEDEGPVVAIIEDIEPRQLSREGVESWGPKRSFTERLNSLSSVRERYEEAKHGVKSKARKISSSVSDRWKRRTDSRYGRLSSGRQTKTPSPMPTARMSDVEHAIDSSESDTPGSRSRSCQQATVADTPIRSSLELRRMRANTEPVVETRRRSMLRMFGGRRTDNPDNVQQTERNNSNVMWNWIIHPPRRRGRAPSTAAEDVSEGPSPAASPRQSLSGAPTEHGSEQNPPDHNTEAGRNNFAQGLCEELQRRSPSPYPYPTTNVDFEEPAASAYGDLPFAAPNAIPSVYACRPGPNQGERGPMHEELGLFRSSTNLLVPQTSTPILRTQTPYFDARERLEEDEEETAEEWFARVYNEPSV